MSVVTSLKRVLIVVPIVGLSVVSVADAIPQEQALGMATDWAVSVAAGNSMMRADAPAAVAGFRDGTS